MRKLTALSGVLLIAGSAVAYAAGIFPGFPTATTSVGNGGAGAPLVGTETMPADVPSNFSAGVMPQTELLTPDVLSMYVPKSSPRNLIIGGDYTVNPFQRGTSQASDITNTVTYGPDQTWLVAGSSGAADWSKQTGASDIIAGFGASLRVQRKASNTDTTAICVGHVFETQHSTPLQGKQVVYSFWALAGGNFSAASKLITATIASGTGSNQSSANFQSASWTNQASATLVAGQNAVFTATNGQFPISTTWTRYTVGATIPVGATQVGVKLCFTPVGTAGTNDWFELIGEQFERAPPFAVTTNGGVSTATGGYPVASPFEYMPADLTLERALRYLYVLNDGAATVRFATGEAISTTVGQYAIPFPEPMRVAPTTTVTTAASFANASSTGTAVNCTTMAAIASSNTTTSGGLSCTGAASLTAGNASELLGQATTGQIQFSSEL